jgi:hypothetical protein
MNEINLDDIKFFLKQKVLDQTSYMGVIEDLGEKVKVCMMFDFGNIKKGEIATVDKNIITQRCKDGSCEVISLESFKEVLVSTK